MRLVYIEHNHLNSLDSRFYVSNKSLISIPHAPQAQKVLMPSIHIHHPSQHPKKLHTEVILQSKLLKHPPI